MYKLLGGKKMTVFYMCFLVICASHFLGNEVAMLSAALTPFVTLLVIGNLGAKKIRQGKSDVEKI